MPPGRSTERTESLTYQANLSLSLIHQITPFTTNSLSTNSDYKTRGLFWQINSLFSCENKKPALLKHKKTGSLFTLISRKNKCVWRNLLSTPNNRTIDRFISSTETRWTMMKPVSFVDSDSRINHSPTLATGNFGNTSNQDVLRHPSPPGHFSLCY